MAQISYEDVVTNNENNYDVGFFNIPPEGEAIVRILCDSVSDLEILTVHPVTVGQSSFPNRSVNCLRTPHDPLDKCPLCNSGEKINQRVFIKMLQYDPETRVPQAVVWDRAASTYVPKLKSYIDNYGPLSNIMCKIVRHGQGLETTYDIIPNINPQMYNLNDFKKDVSAFEEFKVLGRMVLDKSYDDIITFMRTGNFPETSKEGVTTGVEPQESPRPGMAPTGIPNGYQQPYTNQVSTAPNPNMTAYAEGGPAPMDQGSLQRPQRYYQ